MRVTNREIFDRVLGLEQKVDRLMALADLSVPSAQTVHQDYEYRLRSLEKWRYGIPAGILLGLLAFVETLIRRFAA